ncbi:chromosomal replication initiator protein DnaA [Neomegalonema sp.]|uniref:chromosomal replication initiator protein DnaA n=1 Tax=Neomegalonema sp. TaxID=2039713 RepID=UPI002625D1D6|nr:chromosomal replication initiator protein DnaA [Neomegalonema sp.]MDD2868505.1 chromosomal replication initiator protein DnaA [Neomegalonema sp.]
MTARKFDSGDEGSGEPARDSAHEVWASIRRALREDLGEAVFKSWIDPLILAESGEGWIRLGAPSRFLRDGAEARYGDLLREIWRGHGAARVEWSLSPQPAAALRRPPAEEPAPSARAAAAPPKSGALGAKAAAAGGKRRVVPANSDDVGPLFEAATASAAAGEEDPSFLSPKLDGRFTFDNFVVGKSNELAHAAARRVAEAEGAAPFNPLFLYGGVGLGKTHLMHAIAWEVKRARPERRVAYLSAEKFMYQFVSALRYKETIHFKQQFRSVDVLLIDDVQFIAGKDSTQEEFFHTFNALIDQNRQIVISADRSPTDLDGIEERIKSRLGWGLVADIHPTDYELRLGVLQMRAEAVAEQHPEVEIDPKVLEFVASRVSANTRELEGAFNRLLAQATLVGRPITLEMARQILQDLLRSYDRRTTIEEIQRKVAESYNVRLADMLSPRRAQSVARPRQVAMYLSKILTAKSLPEIGRKFGGRDHTTVMHAVKRIEELREVDDELDEEVEVLKRLLEG